MDAALRVFILLTVLSSAYSQTVLTLTGAQVIALNTNNADNLLPVRFYTGFRRIDIPNGGTITQAIVADLDECLRACVNDNRVILPNAADLDCNGVDWWEAAPAGELNCRNHLDLTCSTASTLYTQVAGWTHFKLVHLCDDTRVVQLPGAFSIDLTNLPAGVSTSPQVSGNAADCGLLCNVRPTCIAADFSAFTACRHFDTLNPVFGDCLTTIPQTGSTVYQFPCNILPFGGIKLGFVPNAVPQAAITADFFGCSVACSADPDCVGYRYITVAEFLFPRPLCALYNEYAVGQSLGCQAAVQQRNFFTIVRTACQFTPFVNMKKVGGIPKPQWLTLYECERECHYDSTCTGYDWNKLPTTRTRDRCMFHTEDSGGCENSLVTTEANHYEYMDSRCSSTANMNKCTSTRCQNGGSCSVGVDSYTCSCLPAFAGIICEEKTVTGVRPTVGPQSGGTLITITGTFMSKHGPVTVGGIPCLFMERTIKEYLCRSGRLIDGTKLNMPLEVIVYISNTATTTIQSGFQYRYQADPVIFKIEPLESIESGGALLTVTGQNFDIVETTIMVTTVRSLITFKQYSEETNCIVESSSKMECPTAKINLDLLARRRRRRQAATSINVRENIEVEISFKLDGVQKYTNLSVGSLREYSRITIYTDPVIQKFSPSVLVFTSTWPVEERHLEIKGATLLKGLGQNAYVVRIGDALCGNIDVQDNVITCEPPRTRPQVPDGDYIGANKIPVKVLFGNQIVLLGHLEYVQSVWEYPPSYGILVALCVIVIIIVVIIVCLCKRRPATHDNLGDRRLPVSHDNLNMTERVRR